MTTKDALGNRMKTYECTNPAVQERFVAIRLDGVAFHTITNKITKPFDPFIHQCMVETTIALCKTIQNCVLGYTQSDEINLLMVLKKPESQPWFGGNPTKITSVSASIATYHFNQAWQQQPGAFFDSRIIPLPNLTETQNYFIWRTLDAKRNSILGTAQKHFPHKTLQNKSQNTLINLLNSINQPWQTHDNTYKFGTFTKKTKLPPSTLHVINHNNQHEETIRIERSAWTQHPWTIDLDQIRQEITITTL